MLRHALRTLYKNSGLTLVIVLSMAIGIGANTAVFSVVDALLLRPLPYPDANRLAAIWLHSPGIGIFRDWPSPGQYIDIKNENHSFSDMALAQSRGFTLTGLERPQLVSGMSSQSSLLRMLGAKPLVGRLFLPVEDGPGKPPVAILSHRTWRQLFSSNPGIVGKPITLNGKLFTVVGVLRPDFLLNAEVMPSEGPMDKVDLFLPLPLGADAQQRRGDENYNILVKLKPGVTVAQAQTDINAIAARIRVKDRRDVTFGMHVVGLRDEVVGDVRRVLLVLFGSVTLVLLIACANVANLLLTRAAGREREMAIRSSLGAGWKRLVRQLLTESIVLGILGGAAGLLIAEGSLYLLRNINPGNIPRLDDISINGEVLAFTFALSIATGLLFGLIPAWRAVRVDLNTALKAGGRSGHSDGGLRVSRHSLRGLLVVSEVAFSLMLLIAAGLLIRSFARLQAVPPGFSTDHVLTMRVTASGPRYRDDKAVARFYREFEQRVAQLPGVQAEGAVSVLPLTGEVGWGGINVEGYRPPPGQELQVDNRSASAGYFQAMEIPLIQGRFFSDHDTTDSQQVVVIDQKFANRFWPHENAVGKHLWFDPKKPFTIVGVVGVVKQYGLGADSKIVVYFSQQQETGNSMHLAVRSASDVTGLSAAVTRQIHALDPDVVVDDVRTMQDRLYASLARERFTSTMLSAFAAFALVLAAIGVYGVLSYLVSQSTHDIGVRVALGALPSDIVGLVMGQGMTLACIGIGAGLAGAAALTRVMTSLLFGVSALDLPTFGAVAAILAAAALAASLIPARRATRVDPMVALREE